MGIQTHKPVMMILRHARTSFQWVGLALIGLMLASACGSWGQPKVVELNDRYSLNVARTPRWFPDPKMIRTPAEEEILSKYGKPDYIRFWWNVDGELINSSDLSGRDQQQVGEDMAYADKSWIYYRDKREIVFRHDSNDYIEQDLDEVIGLVCRYGDPNMIQGSRIVDDVLHETWTWIEHGWQYDLIAGKVVKRRRVPKTGAGTSLMK